MLYYLESVLVGIYSSIVYLVASRLYTGGYMVFFITGFLKHLFGYLTTLHTWYCNYGYACYNISHPAYAVYSNNPTYAIYSNYLVVECIIEGALFLGIGSTLSTFIRDPIIISFITGVGLHLLFEALYLHRMFCVSRCKSVSYTHLTLPTNREV